MQYCTVRVQYLRSARTPDLRERSKAGGSGAEHQAEREVVERVVEHAHLADTLSETRRRVRHTQANRVAPSCSNAHSHSRSVSDGLEHVFTNTVIIRVCIRKRFSVQRTRIYSMYTEMVGTSTVLYEYTVQKYSKTTSM